MEATKYEDVNLEHDDLFKFRLLDATLEIGNDLDQSLDEFMALQVAGGKVF